MLFSDKGHKYCAYCLYGAPIEDDMVCCRFRGNVNCESHCLRFRYDPTKRIPPSKQAIESEYSEEDFKL